MNEYQTEADQVVDDATRSAANGAGMIGQVFENAARSGEGQYLIYGLALVFVLMGVTVTFLDYLKSSDDKARLKDVAAREELAKALGAHKIAQAEQVKKLHALAGGVAATKSTKASRALPGLRGTWSGVQSCGWWGAWEETGIRLVLNANAAGHINGVLVFHPILDKSPEVPYGSYRVAGDIQGMEVSLHAGNWILQPPGYKASDLHFNLHKAPISSLTGAIQLKDHGHSLIAVAATLREMLGQEKLTDSCGDVRLYDEVASIEL